MVRQFLALMMCLAVVETLTAQEVVYFRHDHGVAGDDQPLPDDLSKAKLLWRTELPPGHSTPCVCGPLAIVTTWQAEEKLLATVAVDRATGAIRWRQTVPTASIEAVHQSGSPATSSPACNGQQVFSFFGSYGLLCYDMEGKLLWDKKLGPFQDEFGAASSPVLVDNLVILNEDHDIDSFIIAIDQSTGETKWRTTREESTRSYSTPIILQRDGRKEILVAGSLQLTAYDVATGEKVWWFNGLSRIVDSTPVIRDGLIYLATWTPGGDKGERIAMEPFAEALKNYDKNSDGAITQDELPAGGPVLDRFFRIDLNQNQKLEQDEWQRQASVFERAQNIAVALEPGTSGSLAPQYVRWSYDRALPIVPSSVVYAGTMTMVKDSGIVTILDSSSGKPLQQLRAEGRGNYFASLLAGDHKVYMLSESGVLTVLKAGASGEIVSSHDFKERVMASPVAKAGVLYIRTDAALYAYGL